MLKEQQKPHGREGVHKQLLRLLEKAWPSVCCICAQPSKEGVDLCGLCVSHFPFLDVEAQPQSVSSRFMTLCISCGVPLLSGIKHCNSCVNNTSLYAHVVVPFRYAHPIDQFITNLKYRGQLSYSRLLGRLMMEEANRLQVQKPDVFIAMPMHQARYRERGYNQAQELARWCGHYMSVDVKSQWVARNIDTPSLAGLNKASRELEIRGAFNASDDVDGLHVAIVDDVLTTGASSTELARELYDAGACKVSLWVAARTASPLANQADFINMRLSDAGSLESSKLPCPDTTAES